MAGQHGRHGRHDLTCQALPFSLLQQPVITFTSSGNTPGYVQEVNHAGPSNPGLMQTTTSSPLTRDGSNTGNGNYLTSTSPRSPPGSAMSTGGFFSSFRPSSPKVNLLQQNASATTSRDDTATFHSPLMRKGIDRERDNSLSGSESLPKKERRPSSVFEHVGGMLDRFGRRLHSRGDSRDDRHRLSNATAGLSGSAIDVGEGGGSVDEHVSEDGLVVAHGSLSAMGVQRVVCQEAVASRRRLDKARE